jgi:aspartyl/asparaginyl beta-hydroxylase (cupin superfamily)
MLIHTIAHNELQNNNENIQKLKKINKFEIIVWNYTSLLEFIRDKFSIYVNYFKRLLLNKSRENFVKYLIIKEFGGFFINVNILIGFANISSLDELTEKAILNDMIFFYDEKQSDLVHEIFDVYDKIICDDIFCVVNKSNSFINYLVSNIDANIIPTNEYQNKINLGNIFLTRQLETFYLEKFNVIVGNNYWFNNINKKLSDKQSQDKMYEDSIYKINITDITSLNTCKNFYNSKLLTYPNIPELSEPEDFLEKWNFLLKIKNYVENFIMFLLYQYSVNWIIILCVILMNVCINLMLRNFFIGLIDVRLENAHPDSKILFNWKKFKIFKELKKNWKTIRDEALLVMKLTPKLDLSVEDWHDKNLDSSNISNKAGWIKYWNQNYQTDTNNSTNDGTNNINNTININKANNINKQLGNPEWLNFGFYHFGKEFTENLKLCPKTAEILNKFKSHINICGFSWMLGNCVLYPHTDACGLSSGTLALHLGLVIPKPNDVCKLVIKNESNQYVQITESEGKIFVFDATYEHYAYNQSNQDRVIMYIDFSVDLI